MDDTELRQFTEDLKDKADLISVIEATSEYRFDARTIGRYTYCKKPDSLAVDQDWGVYTWFAKAGKDGHQFETGDVFHWLQRYGGMEFWQAATWLADRYGVKIPVRKVLDPAVEKERRTRSEIYEIACTWFEEQFWKTPAAIEYAHKRGLTDETIRRARLGFSSGFDTLSDLVGTFNMHEVNLNDPTAVAIVGKRSGVGVWLQEHHIQDANADWAQDDRIFGLASMPRIVFPHIWRGRVVYFSARNLDWSEDKTSLLGRDKPKSCNLPRSLAGERYRYFNQAFTRGVDLCLVVEGQFDVLSLLQWEIPAVGLVGVGADEELAKLFKNYKVKRVCVALDNDEKGQEAQVKTASLFGPLTRLVTWNILGIETEGVADDTSQTSNEEATDDIEE
jgi:DNA primase